MLRQTIDLQGGVVPLGMGILNAGIVLLREEREEGRTVKTRLA